MPTLKRGTVCELTNDTDSTRAGTKVVVWWESDLAPYCHDLNGNYAGYVHVDNLRPLSGLDALKRVDSVKDGDYVRTVLGVCGDVYLLSGYDNDCFFSGYTLAQMRRLGYKPATPQEPTDDATAEAMALLKSKGFKVVKETV